MSLVYFKLKFGKTRCDWPSFCYILRGSHCSCNAFRVKEVHKTDVFVGSLVLVVNSRHSLQVDTKRTCGGYPALVSVGIDEAIRKRYLLFSLSHVFANASMPVMDYMYASYS